MAASLRVTIGSLLVGSWFSFVMYGVMTFQAYLFLRKSGEGTQKLRVMVSALWCLDTLHVAFISHSLYWYLIVNEASQEAVGKIIWSLPTTIAITAVITLIVQIFFALRIYLLGKYMRFVAVLVVASALARATFGSITTSKAIILGNFTDFQPLVRFYVTTGLTLSVVTDILVTSSLCFYLVSHRTGFGSDTLIDRILRWTIPTGALTSCFGIVSMICAVVMPRNLVWLGVHLIISKLYTTSIIANLNDREQSRAHRRDRSAEYGVNVHMRTMSSDNSSTSTSAFSGMKSPLPSARIAVHIEQEVFPEKSGRRQSGSSQGHIDNARLSLA